MNPDDILGAVLTLGLGVGVFRYASLRQRARLARPRLCSCSHGSGQHDADKGCRGRVIRVQGVTLAQPVFCGCAMFDGCGARAPK